MLAALGALGMTVSAQALPYLLWNGGGSTTYWNKSANWSGSGVPTTSSNLQFGAAAPGAISNDILDGIELGSITFNSGAGAFTLSGYSIGLDSGITNNSSVQQNLNFDLSADGSGAGGIALYHSQTWNAASGNIVVNTSVTYNDNGSFSPLVLTATGGHDITINGAITEVGNGFINIHKTGAGTLTLNGQNTYSGYTMVDGGTLAIGSTGVINYPADTIYVGESGTGTLTINGGSVTNTYAMIGDNLGSSGTAVVNGGGWTNQNDILVGVSGRGVLQINNGTVNNVNCTIGINDHSSGIVTITGGYWITSDNLTIGSSGTGTLNIFGGNVTVNNQDFLMEHSIYLGPGGGTGILNLGNGTTVGYLSATDVFGGDSALDTVNFNHNTNYNFSPGLHGYLAVNQLGSGTTTLGNQTDYMGPTTVKKGTLIIASGYITSTVTVGDPLTSDTPTFGGACNITGDVHILNNVGSGGAILSPDAASMGSGAGLTMVIDGGLTLDSHATLSMEFGGSAGHGLNSASDISTHVSVTSITLNGSKLQLSRLGSAGSILTGDVFYLVLNSGSETGRFGSVTGGSSISTGGYSYGGNSYDTFTFNGKNYAISYAASQANNLFYTGGTDIALMVIPEPCTWTMLACGFCVLMFVQRVRRKSTAR